MEIHTYSGKSFSKTFRFVMLVVGAFLIYSAILSRKYFGFIVGLAFILSSFFSKEVTITEEGILYKRNNLGRQSTELIPFTEFSTLGIEPKGSRTVLHLLKGQMVKVIIVDSKDVDDIMELAKLKNKKICFEKIDNNQKRQKIKFKRKKSDDKNNQ